MSFRFTRIATLLALAFAPLSVAAKVPPKRDGVWAQSYVDRAPDPAIRYGTLPNGLRYAILRNATPPGQMALRLVIRSGSLVEQKGSEGVAHFLEHMAFRGSKSIADGEVMRMLQRKGLAVGADSNAGTSPESTIYQFNFPSAGKENVDTGLTILREIAGELTLDAKTIDAERGAVLSEERLRDNPGLRGNKALLGFLLPGQPAADHLPIGTIDSITHAGAAELRAYYEAHYRPENAAIVAVGEFDPGEMEAAIRARFGDWRGKGAAPRPVDLGRPARRGEEARLFSEPGAPSAIQISWIRPYDDRADTAERTRNDLNRLVGAIIFNQRLGDLARRSDAPFLGAGLSQTNALKSANITSLSVNATADKQLSAMRAAIGEQRRMLQYGINQPEFDRAITTLKGAVSNMVASAATRPTPALANKIAKDILDNEVTRSPQQDLVDYEAWLRTANLKDAEAAIRASFTGSGPLLFVGTPRPPDGGDKAVLAAFDEANRDKIVAMPLTQTAGWPYTSFGAPGTVTDRKEIADLGVTILTFVNGTRLAVKPTQFAKNEILVSAGFGQGRLGLAPDRAHAYWLATATPAFTEGGTGKVTAGEIQRNMAGRVIGIGLQTQDNSFQLIGRTRPADLPVELQVITAYLSDPGFRPEAVTRLQAMTGNALPQIEANPAGVLGRELGRLLHDGDPRWTILPSADQLAQTKPQDLIMLLEPALGGQVDLVMVGDLTVDQAIAAVAPTLGALPPRRPWVAPSPAGVRFPDPTPTPKTLVHAGRADQSRAFAAWPARDFHASPADARALLVIAAIVRQRLFDTIREKEGSTYTPETNATASTTLPGYGFFTASVEMPPAKIPGFFKALDETLADLRTKPVSADELDRAKRPLIESRTRDRQNNGYWFATLPAALRDPREYDAIRSRVTGVEAVSAADVQRVAHAYLRPEKAWRVMVMPKGQ